MSRSWYVKINLQRNVIIININIIITGANLVISHREPLKPQLDAAGIDGVDYIFNSHDPSVNLDQFAAIIKPFGKIVSIASSPENLDLTLFFTKRVTFTWELMFTRGLFEVDMIEQHHILNDVSKLVDSGLLKSHVEVALPYNLENLRKAHSMVESGKMIGKVVLHR
jgi:NADPH:quinone reductase